MDQWSLGLISMDEFLNEHTVENMSELFNYCPRCGCGLAWVGGSVVPTG